LWNRFEFEVVDWRVPEVSVGADVGRPGTDAFFQDAADGGGGDPHPVRVNHGPGARRLLLLNSREVVASAANE
jgi:hypothetical protein